MPEHMRRALRRAYASRMCVGHCAAHMPLAMHVRTNELTYAEPTYLASGSLRLINACGRIRPVGVIRCPMCHPLAEEPS